MKTNDLGTEDPRDELHEAAKAAAARIEQLLPPGDAIGLSTGATYRVASVAWDICSWYGSDDIATHQTDLRANVLVRIASATPYAEALYDPRYVGQLDGEARSAWLPSVGMSDAATGEEIHLASHATLLAFAREHGELVDGLRSLELSERGAIEILRAGAGIAPEATRRPRATPPSMEEDDASDDLPF